MLTAYIHAMIRRIRYSIDENGTIIANIPGEQGYYAQGDNHEEARDNLIDVIEMLMLDKIKSGDKKAIKELERASLYHDEYAYA